MANRPSQNQVILLQTRVIGLLARQLSPEHSTIIIKTAIGQAIEDMQVERSNNESAAKAASTYSPEVEAILTDMINALGTWSTRNRG